MGVEAHRNAPLAEPGEADMRVVKPLDNRTEPGAPMAGSKHHQQMGGGDNKGCVADENPAAEGPWVGVVKDRRQRGAELAECLPGKRRDPGAEREWTLTKAGSLRRAVLGVAARRRVEPQVVEADPVALLVVLTGAELVEQIEGRGRVIVEDEQGVPPILAPHRALAHDDGADRAGDARDDGRRLGDLDLLGLGADVTAG